MSVLEEVDLVLTVKPALAGSLGTSCSPKHSTTGEQNEGSGRRGCSGALLFRSSSSCGGPGLR